MSPLWDAAAGTFARHTEEHRLNSTPKKGHMSQLSH